MIHRVLMLPAVLGGALITRLVQVQAHQAKYNFDDSHFKKYNKIIPREYRIIYNIKQKRPTLICRPFVYFLRKKI